ESVCPAAPLATDVPAAEAGDRAAGRSGNVDVAAAHDRDIDLVSGRELDIARPDDRDRSALAPEARNVDIAGSADRDARAARGAAGGDVPCATDVEAGLVDLKQADFKLARSGNLAFEAVTLDAIDADSARTGLGDPLELRHRDVEGRPGKPAPVAPIEPALRPDHQRVALDHRLKLSQRPRRALGADRLRLAEGDDDVLWT